MNNPAPPIKSRRRRFILIGAGVVALALLVWSIDWLAYRYTHSISKDAFVDSYLINVSPQVAGDIVEVFVQEQGPVRKGQVMARVDPAPFTRDVNLAEARRATAQAAFEKATADLKLLSAEVPKRIAIADMKLAIARDDEVKAEDALAMVRIDVDRAVDAATQSVAGAKATFTLADEDYRRYDALFRDGSVTQRKLQEATRTQQTAKADLRIAEAKLAQAEANRKQASIAEQQKKAASHAVAEAAAGAELARLGDLQIDAAKRLVGERQWQVEEARRGLEVAQLKLDYTRVVAPYDGVIAKKWRHLGDYARTGDPIFSMYNPNLLFVTVHLEETLLEGVSAGNFADLRVEAFRRPFRGRVLWVGSATGANFSLIPRDISSGEFTYVVQRVPTRILFEPDERLPLLKPGLSATAAIEHGDGDPAWAADALRRLGQIEGVPEKQP